MEEKAAVFAPLRQMDAISVSAHLSVHALQSPRMHAEWQILLLECMACIKCGLVVWITVIAHMLDAACFDFC